MLGEVAVDGDIGVHPYFLVEGALQFYEQFGFGDKVRDLPVELFLGKPESTEGVALQQPNGR